MGGMRPAVRASRRRASGPRHGQLHDPDGVLYGRGPPPPLRAGAEDGRPGWRTTSAERTSHMSAASPLERAQETGADRRVGPACRRVHRRASDQGGQRLGGQDLRGRRRRAAKPDNWKHLTNPFRPSWGEPYIEQVVRMMGALDAARDAARGHEAVCVSHQLPIWIVRSFVERRRLWHDPRKRQCTLASLTTFTYQGDKIVSVGYTEPARDLVPAHSAGRCQAGEGEVQGVRSLDPSPCRLCGPRRSVGRGPRRVRPTSGPVAPGVMSDRRNPRAVSPI